MKITKNNKFNIFKKLKLWRTALLFVVMVPSTFFRYVIILFLNKSEMYGERINNLMRGWCRLNLKVVGIKVKVEGEENIVQDSSFVLLANHQSAFDINVLGAYIPATIRFMAKKELFKFPIFGDAMKRIGIISVDRQNKTKAFNSIQRTIQLLQKNKIGVIGFPEGTRTPDGEVKNFKSGLFIMAINSKLPIVPVSISGAYNICNKHSLLITPGTIRVKIHPPVLATDVALSAKRDLISKVKTVIMSGIEE